MKYIIAENGNFPPQYNVLEENKDGIYRVVFGPDPDLEDAQRKLDSKRVATFFSTYEQATGNANDARETRSSNSELVKQVAPGRGRSTKPVAGEGKTYSRADITKFFEDVRFGKYKGREDERAKKERDIFAAQQEGRIA